MDDGDRLVLAPFTEDEKSMIRSLYPPELREDQAAARYHTYVELGLGRLTTYLVAEDVRRRWREHGWSM